MMDPAGLQMYQLLLEQLGWLRANHPDKTALIGVAEGYVQTIRLAGSCDSLTVGTNGLARFQRSEVTR